MATLATLTESDVIALSERLGEPSWLLERRLEAYKAFADLPWPDRRVEEWRYTDPARIDLTRPLRDDMDYVEDGYFVSRTMEPRSEGVVAMATGGTSTEIALSGADGYSSETFEAERCGVVVSDLPSAAREHEDIVRAALGSATGADGKFTAANLASFDDSAFFHVPADVELDGPLVVTVRVDKDRVVRPRILVVLGPHARARLLIDHCGDAAATVVEVVELVLGEGARLDVVSVQDWGPRVDHIGAHAARVGANADLRHLEVTLGGRTVYLTPDVRLAEPGGTAELLGAYVTKPGQMVEHRSLIHHDASATTSETIYKGALAGDSTASWYGNIRIEPHAKATASDETNRNLLLSADARANSIPFLEILCSDVVRCGHHSSVGQLDELQLFYLTSRGIPEAQARRLLVLGFFADVVERIDLPGVKDAVLAEVAALIGGS